MTDYMNEAERLLSEYGDAVSDVVLFAQDPAGYSRRVEATRAAMLAHIQRGAVPEGWQLVPSADQLWNNDEVMALNAELGLTIDQLSRLASAITRIAHPADWRERFSQAVYDDLAAADNQDFPLEEYPARILKVLDAVIGREIKPAPAGVPMPQPIGFIDSDDDETWATLTQNAHELATLKLRSAVFHVSQMRTYGAACRAAGYARGLRDAVRDANPLVQNGEVLVTVTGLTGSGKSAIAGEIEIMCRALGLEVEWGEGAAEKHLTHADWTNALEMYRPRVRIVEANIPRTDAALSGEVKP